VHSLPAAAPAAVPSLDGRIRTTEAVTPAPPTLSAHPTWPEPPPPCGRWEWLCTDTGEVRPFRCHRWNCPTCAPLLADRWSRIIAEAHPQRHVVLTALGPDPVTARTRLRNITKALRRGEAHGFPRRPRSWQYFCALEGREAPGFHAHLLQSGDSVPQRSLSDLAARYGAGRVAWIKSLQGDHLRRARLYVAKHLIGRVHPNQLKPGRRIRYSRAFWGAESAPQVALRLFPPSPFSWVLRDPDRARRDADREALHQQRLIDHEDWLLAHVPVRFHEARGIGFPVYEETP